MHLRKTDIFMEMVESGKLPLRPGVKALVSEAIANGVKVAVCSTSNEKAVSAIVENMLGEDVAKVMPVYAGDMVPRKKPDPAIYLMAAEKLGVKPEKCVVALPSPPPAAHDGSGRADTQPPRAARAPDRPIDPRARSLRPPPAPAQQRSCVVIEDSHIGMCAAKAAGMRCVVTTSPYTEDEEFDAADAIFPCIGDGDESNFTLTGTLTFPGPLFTES